jgi:beta-glucosidase
MPEDPLKEKHDHKALIFPEGFLWGSATSAFQVEGNDINSDWWAWEQDHQPTEKRSGQAADHYNRYVEDFDLAKKLGQNSHRLSIEWARIEPREGEFDQIEIDHYKDVLKSLKDRGFTVMLTLWHFSNPEWIAKKGGWENGKTAWYFNRFVKRIVPEIKEYVDFWITVNEPGVYTFMAYLGGEFDGSGVFPPGKKSNWSAIKATWNLKQAHKKAYKTIHKLIPNAKVGMAQNLNSFDAYHKHSITEQLAVILSDIFSNHIFYFLTKGYHDFIGVNYYFHHRYRKTKGLIPKLVDEETKRREASDLGWEIYPEGLFDVLADVSDGLPIYITEVGIAASNDDRRTRFLITYLQEVYRAINAGIKVKGFFYWSLIDNMELHRGFDPKFGLIEVNFETQKRTPRPSAYVYKEIIKRNGIPHDLLKLLGHGIKVSDVLEEDIKE